MKNLLKHIATFRIDTRWKKLIVDLIKRKNKAVIFTLIGSILIFSIGMKLANTGSKMAVAIPIIKDVYAVNEAVKLNNAIVTVTKVVKTRSGKYDLLNGMEFVIVSVSIKNIGEGKISYSPSDFQMKNSKGQIIDEDIAAIINSDTELSGGNLDSNETVTGTIGFMQPINDNALVLKYNANFLNQKEIKFKLN